MEVNDSKQVGGASGKRSFLRRLVRRLAVVALGVAAIAGAAFLGYYFYGWSDWKPLGERDGIAVFSMKRPGSSLIVYKGVARFPVSLTSITRFMQDPSACDDVGCTDPAVLETVSPQIQYMSFVYDYAPFDRRQFVVKVEVSQDPVSLEVRVHYLSDDSRVPPHPCCVRVPHMDNTWRFRPVGNGLVEVEYVVDEAEGGWIPFFIANMIHETVAHDALAGVREFVGSEKFRKKYIVGAKPLPYITEPTLGAPGGLDSRSRASALLLVKQAAPPSMAAEQWPRW